MTDDIQIRDRRSGNTYNVHNAVYDMGLSCEGLAMYNCLCRYANDNERPYFSGKKWKKHHKVGNEKLTAAKAELIDRALIRDTGKKNRQGAPIYEILDHPDFARRVSYGGTGGYSEAEQGGVLTQNRGVFQGGTGGCSEVEHKQQEKTTRENNKRKQQRKVEPAAPSESSSDDTVLHNRIKTIFDQGYAGLTGYKISWDGKDIATHQRAIKSIIAKTSGNVEDRIKEIRARAARLYEMVYGDKAKAGFWWQQQFLYATLANNWNKIIPEDRHYEEKKKGKNKSWLESGEFTDSEIVETLVRGLENGNLLPEGWEKWESKVIEELKSQKKDFKAILEKYRQKINAHTTSATAAAG